MFLAVFAFFILVVFAGFKPNTLIVLEAVFHRWSSMSLLYTHLPT